MKKRILLIDDDRAICEALKILLSDLCEVIYFNDIKAAKLFLESNSPVDLIILDYNINNESGIQFHKEEIEMQQPLIPAILISGFIVTQLKSDKEIMDLKNRFVQIFEKPFDFIEFRRCIKKYLTSNK